MKTLDDYFSDWESHVFGYGYGTGEPAVLYPLRDFFVACLNYNYQYDYVEGILGKSVTWLLINALCHADIIEYGTSPRYGWMTHDYGRKLCDYVVATDPDKLVALANRDEEYIECYPDHCNCDHGPCENPFWRNSR